MNEIAIASVPVQEWEVPYPLPQALQKGVFFRSFTSHFLLRSR